MIRAWLACASVALSCSTGALSAQFPERPITVLVPYAESGPTATLAHALVPELSRNLGQPVELVFRGGDGATKGTKEVADSGGEGGYKLLLHNIGMASAATFYRKLSYDPVRDFIPIARLGDAPMLLLGRAGLPVDSTSSLWSYVRRNQDSLTVAYGGPGGAGQLCGLLLERALGVKLFWIPFQGTGPALADLVKGRSDLLCDQTTHTLPAVTTGKVRALVLAADRRLGVLPELPTAAESGMPDLKVAVWHGLFAVKGTPPDVVARLAAATRAAVASPEFVAKMQAVGVVPATEEEATPGALSTLLLDEVARWRTLIEATGQYAN